MALHYLLALKKASPESSSTHSANNKCTLMIVIQFIKDAKEKIGVKTVVVIEIYSILSLGHDSCQIPWDFLGGRNVFYSNEETLGSFKMEAGDMTKQRAGDFNPVSQPLRREGGPTN